MKSLITRITHWAREAEEKQKLKVERVERLKHEEEMRERAFFNIDAHIKFRQLDFFPGSLSDYSSLKGTECEIIDTGWQNKEVEIDTWWNPSDSHMSSSNYIRNYSGHGQMQRTILLGRLYKSLLEQGACGLIYGYWRTRNWDNQYSGVPVREKKLR